MSLHKWQVEEIAAFDWKKRAVHDFDGRRYGSVTGRRAPHFTEAWCPCHGSDLYNGKKRPTRKTLRYNYIVRAEARRSEGEGKARRSKGEENARRTETRPDVTVVHVAVRLNRAYRQVVKEVGRWHIKTGKLELRDIDYHGIGGWIVDWQEEDWAGGKAAKAARSDTGGGANREAARSDTGGGANREAARSETGPLIAKPIDDGWYNGGKWKFNMGLTFPWHEVINLDALKGTRYEYCQYADDTPCKAGLVDWLIMYRQEPKIELLAKMGLYNLICPGGIKALKDKRIRDWIIAHREEAAGNHDAVDIIYAARHDVPVKYAAKRRNFILDVKSRTRYRNDRVKVKLDYDRLMKTLPKWHVRVEEYLRYLEYSIKCGLDLRNEGTAYPPTKGGREAFMDRLEDMEARARKKARAEIRAKRAAERAEEKWIRDTMKTRIKELEAFQKSVERCSTIKGCGYAIVLAKTQKELLAEGRKMGNCVGCGTYGRAIVKGDSLIVMLKRAEARRSESYCDCEIDRKTWKVRQCYLKGNELAPKEVQELAKRLAAWFKEEHKRHMKRGTFKELRSRSPQAAVA